MDRDDTVEIIFLGIEIAIAEIIDHNCFMIRMISGRPICAIFRRELSTLTYQTAAIRRCHENQ